MTIIRDALSILARIFGLKPGPDVERIKEPPKRDAEVERLAKSMLQDQVTAVLPQHMWSSSGWESLTEAQREAWRQRARTELAKQEKKS